MRQRAAMTSRAGGFTLVELLLAMTITAMLATSAIATLGMFAESNARAVENIETKVDVERALKLFRRDIVEADALEFGVRQLTITRIDGSVVGYATPAGGYELQRIVAANKVDIGTRLAAAQLGAATPQYDLRGRLLDKCYSATAIIQGTKLLALTAVTSARNGATIGVHLRVEHVLGDTTAVNGCTAVSLRLAEQNAKP